MKEFEKITLGEVAEYINGRGFKKSEWKQTGLPIIRIQNLTESRERFNYYEGPIDEKYIVESGDLLVSWAATLGVYIWNGPKAVLNQHIFKVVPKIEKKLLYFVLSYKIGELYSKSHGTGMVHITKNRFESLEIIIPKTIENQKLLVQEIEKQFSRLDEAVKSLKSLKQLLVAYRRSLLNSVYDTANAKEVILREITEKIQDGSHFSPQKQFLEKKEHSYKYITAKNVRNYGLELSNITYIEKDFFDSIYPRCNVREGDVLLTKDGANTGMCCINTLKEPFALLSSVAILRGKKDILDNKYLLFYLKSPKGFNSIAGKMTGTAIKRIILRRIKEAKIPLVRLELQKQIVQEIEERFSVIDKLEETVDNSIEKTEKLRKSILKSAFEGKLVKFEAG